MITFLKLSRIKDYFIFLLLLEKKYFFPQIEKIFYTFFTIFILKGEKL